MRYEQYISIRESGGSSGIELEIGVFSDPGLTTPITDATFGDTIYLSLVPTGGTGPYNYTYAIQTPSGTYTHQSGSSSYALDCNFIGSINIGGYIEDSSSPVLSAYTVTEKNVFISPVLDSYVRNPQWLNLPALIPSEEVVYGLYAVFDVEHNYVALRVQGDYTVDWGDGTVVSYASGTIAEHDFSWAAVGNVTDFGYRQSIVKIYPQSGSNLTSIDFNRRHSSVSSSNRTTGWLDVLVQAANCTSFTFYTSNIEHRMLEQFIWEGSHSISNMSQTFRDCTALEKVQIDVSSVITLFQTFYGCWSLIEVNNGSFIANSATSVRRVFELCRDLKWLDEFSVSSATTTDYNFSQCGSLLGLRTLNLSSSTNASYFFNGCITMIYAPFFDASSISTLQSFYQNCSSLQEIPLLIITSATSLAAFVAGCTSLRKFPLIDTSGVQIFTQLADGCTSLVEFPDLDFSSATVVRVLLRNCYSLLALPDLNFPLATDIDQLLDQCRSLARVESVNAPNALDPQNMFDGCQSLVYVGPITLSASANDFQYMFSTTFKLKDAPSVNTTNATVLQLMFYYSGIVNYQTVDCGSTTSLYRMFYLNSGLIDLDFLTNTSGVTNFRGLVRDCQTVQTISGIDWSSATNMTFTFLNAYNLRRIQGGNIPITFTIANCNFEAAELDELFTDLPVVSGKTVTVTGNPGAATCNTTIATGKGWTVVT